MTLRSTLSVAKLVRALRARAHALAERLEEGRAASSDKQPSLPPEAKR